MIQSAWRIFRNETAKMLRLRMIYLGPLCALAVAAVFALNLRRLPGGASENGWAILTQTAKTNVTGVIPIFLLVYGAFAVAGEVERGTIRMALARPVGRLGFLLGKTMACLFYMAILLGSAALAGAAMGAAFGRFGPVMDFGETIWTPGQIAWRLGLCFLMAGVPLAAVAVLALAISVFSRSLFGAVGFAIGFWITLMLVQELLAGIWTIGGFDMAELLFTRNLDISLRVAEMLSSGATAPWSQPGLVFAMASAAAWAVALFLASWARFHWQDLNK